MDANLRRHYHSIADLFILGLLFTGATLFFGRPKPFSTVWVLIVADSALLLITIVAIYMAKTPWASVTVRTLIWVAFLVAFFFNVIAPLLSGQLLIPAVVIYALLFPYLFWLEWRAHRANADGPGAMIDDQFSAEPEGR